eukprot:COSAG01_NODE_66432_length_270_cov_0.602339_1_plen_31_part_10
MYTHAGPARPSKKYYLLKIELKTIYLVHFSF